MVAHAKPIWIKKLREVKKLLRLIGLIFDKDIKFRAGVCMQKKVNFDYPKSDLQCNKDPHLDEKRCYHNGRILK